MKRDHGGGSRYRGTRTGLRKRKRLFFPKCKRWLVRLLISAPNSISFFLVCLLFRCFLPRFRRLPILPFVLWNLKRILIFTFLGIMI